MKDSPCRTNLLDSIFLFGYTDKIEHHSSTLPTTSQYPVLLLPTRIILPSFLSNVILLFTDLSDKPNASLNCFTVIFGFCKINSNILGTPLVQEWCKNGERMVKILHIFLQSYYISTSFMHWNIHEEVTSVLICLNRYLWRAILGKFILYSWNTRTTSFCQFQFLQEITEAIGLIST